MIYDLQEQLADAQKEIEFLRQQLADSQKREAEAIAACKLKDEALRDLLDDQKDQENIYDAFFALDVQPDDSALKAWLGEPIAWMHYNTQGELLIATKKPSWDESVWPPLYHPKGLK